MALTIVPLEVADDDLLALVDPVVHRAEEVLGFASDEAELGAEDRSTANGGEKV